LVAVVDIQLIEYLPVVEAVVTAGPRLALSSLNCTLAIPVLLVGKAETVAVPDTVAPFKGIKTEIEGPAPIPMLAVMLFTLPAMLLTCTQ
jgi:hypothetical protein